MATTPFLTVLQLAKAQAEAEGFQNGPTPPLNAANTNTQDTIGNIQAVIVTPAPPAPYYSNKAVTPNLQLALDNMSAEIANNFVIIDQNTLVQTLTIAITRPQILALATAPILLLPGTPGVFFSMVAAVVELIAGTIPYSVGGANLQIQIGNSFNFPLNAPFEEITAAGFLDQSVNTVAGLINGTLVEVQTSSSVSGQGIYLTSSGPNVTLGNGTLKITVTYNAFVL